MKLSTLCPIGIACVVAGWPSATRAGGALLTDDTFDTNAQGTLLVDGGLVVGFPAALPTGLSKGIGAGVTRGGGFAYGVRATWTTATESSLAWTVTQSDLRVRAVAALQHAAGRGTLALRLGAGATLVHETRTRNQGARAGLTGSDLMTSAWATLPAADLEAVITLYVIGPWAMVVSGGPTIELLDGAAHGTWSAELGVAWQP